MIHFKKHNLSGSVFIEVMFALVLLAIFGTSLFMVQSVMFTKTFTAHSKVIALGQINSLNLEFEVEKHKLLEKKEPLKDLQSKQEVTAPLERVTIEFKDIPEESALHKKFAESVKIIQQSAQFDNKKEVFLSFEFAPPIFEKEEKGSTT